jgi:hypothetical protein
MSLFHDEKWADNACSGQGGGFAAALKDSAPKGIFYTLNFICQIPALPLMPAIIAWLLGGFDQINSYHYYYYVAQ